MEISEPICLYSKNPNNAKQMQCGVPHPNNKLLVQSILLVTWVNQSKHQSDHVFGEKCWFIICDQIISLCLQLDGSDKI